MNETERYTRVAGSLAAALAALGLWIVLAPFLLPGAEFAPTHAAVGAAVAAVAARYAVQIHRDPSTKTPSLWFVLVLGALLLTGALLGHTPGTVFFWSAVLASALTVSLAAVSILWGSRFGAGRGRETTIFER